MNKIFILAFILALLSTPTFGTTAPWIGNSLNGEVCNGGAQGYGPFDYLKRNQLKANLKLVESAHFTPDVENLIKGNTTVNPEGDINYTLRAWPNHHRALLSIINLQVNINAKISPYKNLKTPPECYLQRALHFSPADAFSYSLYGYFLRKIGNLEEAKKKYIKALEIDPDNIRISYSYSLLLIELKEYSDALKYAKIAYRDKSTPKGLKNKLIKLKIWDE